LSESIVECATCPMGDKQEPLSQNKVASRFQAMARV
jgi:hypothetical protein